MIKLNLKEIREKFLLYWN